MKYLPPPSTIAERKTNTGKKHSTTSRILYGTTYIPGSISGKASIIGTPYPLIKCYE
jgi:hypothetical protein